LNTGIPLDVKTTEDDRMLRLAVAETGRAHPLVGLNDISEEGTYRWSDGSGNGSWTFYGYIHNF